MPAPRPPAGPLQFAEAVEWHRQRVPMTDAEFAQMQGDAHERAFKVAGVAQLDLVREVFDAVDHAVSQGATLKEFADAVEGHLTTAWGGEQPWRVETIFRTNVQHAYSRGRWEQQTDPAVKSLRPFWWFMATLDYRTTPECRAANGTVLSADDPFWLTHNPPLHHQCRSTIASLTERQARAQGITPAAPSVEVDDGFGGAPGADDWHVDWGKYPPELAAAGQKKLGTTPPPPIPKSAPPPPLPAPRPAPAQPPPPPAPAAPPPATPPPALPAPSPAPAPAPPAPSWAEVKTVKEGMARLKTTFDVDPMTGTEMRDLRNKITGGRALRGIDEALLPVKMTKAAAVEYLNRVGHAIADSIAAAPALRDAIRGLRVAGSPVKRGACFPKLGVVSFSRLADADWNLAVVFNDGRAAAGLPRAAAKTIDDHLVSGSTHGTVRHELAHWLDRQRVGSGSSNTYGTEERAGRGQLGWRFFEPIEREAKAAGLLGWREWARKNVSDYAATNRQEAWAETVTKFTSPGYKPGMLPRSVEDALRELLEIKP